MRGEEQQGADDWPNDPFGPVLSDLTRMRLGRELQAMYEPVIDESLDPRLAELMRQLEADRSG